VANRRFEAGPVRLGINQPYLFPYLGFFQLLHAVDRFVFYDDVSFIKQGWIHRNRLLINGTASLFTVPVRDRSSNRPIREILIDDEGNGRWRPRLLKTIDNAYRRAPEFGAVFPLLEQVLDARVSRVGELARLSIETVAAFLEIKTKFVASSTVYGNGHLVGEVRVLDICQREGVSEYVNLPGGRQLYSADHFADRGVRLRFVASTPPTYRQFGTEFVPDLSIIDVLMFNSRPLAQTLLATYSLQ
jgi:hypothetical protein